MAIARRSNSNGDLASPGGTTTITLPSGVAATDVVTAVFVSTRNSTTNPNIVTAPAGWTSVSSVVSANDGTNEVSIYTFWALGNVANLGFTNSQTSGLKQGWSCTAWTGVDNASPIDATAIGNSGNPGLATNGIIIANANSIHIIPCGDLNSHSITNSAGFSSDQNGASNASATLLYDTTPLSAGATGSKTISIGVSDPGDVLAAQPFSLKVAATITQVSGTAGPIGVGVLTPGVKVSETDTAALVGVGVVAASGSAVSSATSVYGNVGMTGVGSLSAVGNDVVPFVPPSNPNVEFDVRLYNANRTRKYMPRFWVDECQFEIGERGGFQNGNIQLYVPWESLTLTGSEFVDVWLWGQRVYRGYVKMPQKEIGVPERQTPTLFGLMEVLNGYVIRRKYSYAAQTPYSQLFQDICRDFVSTSSRLPTLVLDTTGLDALGLYVSTFDGRGKTVSQAMNEICDSQPGQFIWGCDVDSNGYDRMYLRPRTMAVVSKYSIGEKVAAFVYPVDTTKVVNRVYLTGGKVDSPNLCPNASFEESIAPGEVASNLLEEPSFEQAHDGTFPSWSTTGNPTIRNPNDGISHSGSQSPHMDNNPSGPEALYQDVPYQAGKPINASCWTISPAAETWNFKIQIQTLTSGHAVLNTYDSGYFHVPNTDNWTHQQVQWNPAPDASAVYVRVKYITDPACSGSRGMNIDDCSLWYSNYIESEHWTYAVSNATAVIDWANHDVTPKDTFGFNSCRIDSTILSAGGYVEISLKDDTDKIPIKPGRWYYVTWWVYATSGMVEFDYGWRGYIGTTLGGLSTVGQTYGNTTIDFSTSPGWHQLTRFAGHSVGGGDGAIPVLRVYSTGRCYVDAVGFTEGAIPDAYYPEDKYVSVRDTDYYARSTVLSADALSSITNYGEREKTETVESIVDSTGANNYFAGYFNAHAVPEIQARLSLFAPTAPLPMTGSVKIENLPSAPAGLFPSRIRYQIGREIHIEADLSNERPDMAGLLRLIQSKNI